MSFSDLIIRYPTLRPCQDSIEEACKVLISCFEADNRLYVFGNGGSAADALHIVGELGKSFIIKRKIDPEVAEKLSPENAAKLQAAFPAFALVENSALSSAYANDVDADYVFAQQVYAYARKGDCVLGISTSGNSSNVLRALEVAKARGAHTIGLTGRDGGNMKELCDVCIVVPETETFRIQELHLPVYHAICIAIEEYFWNKEREC